MQFFSEKFVPLTSCSYNWTHFNSKQLTRVDLTLSVFYQDNKILDGTKLKAFADDKYNLICGLVNPLRNNPWFLRVCKNKSFANTVGKIEIARNKQISLSPTLFFTHKEKFLPFSQSLKLSYANYFNLEKSKICCMGKG